jgi:SAM-dependent methyltransferase
MHGPPRLFDRDLLFRHRARAEARGRVDFLHEAVAAEITERLAEVNRRFHDAVVIGPRPDIWVPALDAAVEGGVRAIHDTEVLDVGEGEADLVVHGLALHWSNDPVGQLVQMRRALRPDGLMIAALFGGETLAELRAAFAEAEVDVLGGLSPRVAPMGEIRDLGGLLQRAGFALPVADSLRLDVRYGTVLDLMRELRGMGETSVLADRLRRPMRRELLGRVGAIYAERFGGEDGRVGATFEVVFLTGWAPSADQPKPLRPGSARVRLAEAMGTTERSAGEKAGDG